MDGVEHDSVIDGDITIIITTSPVPSNPSTKMLSTVMDGIRLSPYLAKCPTIVVFDGFCIVDENQAQAQYKSSHITSKQSEDYKDFKSAMHDILSSSFKETSYSISSYDYIAGPSATSTVIQRTLNNKIQTISHSIRVGFALAVHSALHKVKTKYVLIQQHDWCFRVTVPLTKLLKTLDEEPKMNYIGFLSRKVLDYARRKTDRAPSVPSEVVVKNSEPFTRLCFWYDKPHIARTEYYKTKVFGQKRFRRGYFIEDTFGHLVLNESRNEGLEGWSRYGCWLWYPNQGLIPTVQHLNGRRFHDEPGYWAKNDDGKVQYILSKSVDGI